MQCRWLMNECEYRTLVVQVIREKWSAQTEICPHAIFSNGTMTWTGLEYNMVWASCKVRTTLDRNRPKWGETNRFKFRSHKIRFHGSIYDQFYRWKIWTDTQRCIPSLCVKFMYVIKISYKMGKRSVHGWYWEIPTNLKYVLCVSE